MTARMVPVDDSVPLVDAFAWVCPSCSTKNYVDAEEVQMSEEDHRELCIRMGEIEEWQPTPERVSFISAPGTVKCHSCHNSFATFDPSAEDEDD